MEFGDLFYEEDVILKKIQEGDRETYRLLFKDYYKVLCLYATSLTRNESNAEDIVQNVFLNLWAKREKLQIQSSLKSYLFKSTHNIFINDYRRKRLERHILDEIHLEVLQKSIEEEEDNLKKRLDWINMQIESLPPKSREIFVMNKRRGLSYKEIAEMLGISENTVESHIGRALKRIRNSVSKYFFFLLVFPRKEIED